MVPHETSFDYGIDSQALSPSYIVALEQEGSHGLAVAGHGLSAALERRMGDCMAVCLGLYLALYFSATTQDCHVIHTNYTCIFPTKGLTSLIAQYTSSKNCHFEPFMLPRARLSKVRSPLALLPPILFHCRQLDHNPPPC